MVVPFELETSVFFFRVVVLRLVVMKKAVKLKIADVTKMAMNLELNMEVVNSPLQLNFEVVN
ncbi:hypothetical protein GBA52_003067 [Prunus armeniaca]|nr:hypothetical protein GBA52_003067 [Prunus armeniaca]